MSKWQLDTPVALFIFNRPEKTAKVMEQVSSVEPATLFVVADGPRQGNPRDSERVEQARQVVQEGVDWDCEVRWNRAEINIGLKRRFTTGLEWIFEREREAIILEDDVLPSDSFFRFCSELLERYRDDERIMDISGTNHLSEWKPDKQDYHFSHYGGIWGWATWRRSWEWYDPDMELWSNEAVRKRVRDVISNKNQADYIEYIFEKVYSGEIDTWDYQWGFARYINSALSVVPSRNLVSNIGFGREATNTTAVESDMADLQRYELTSPFTSPSCVTVDREYDRQFHQMRPITQRNKLLRAGREMYDRLLK